MTDRYEDIISLPHHISKRHAQMSLIDRAAQFSPFAALTGYGDALAETARQTTSHIVLSEEEKAMIDERLQTAAKEIASCPELSITYFLPDQKKDGGAYITITGILKRIDEYDRMVLIADGTKIPVEEIIHIEGNLFKTVF